VLSTLKRRVLARSADKNHVSVKRIDVIYFLDKGKEVSKYISEVKVGGEHWG
jgi:hypothetical protein